MSDSYSPPSSVRSAARRGLELRAKSGKGGLTNKEASAQGIGSGVQRARNLANGDGLTLSTVKRMKAFFDRHAKNKGIAAGKKPEDDAGHVSWLLWGGDAGRAWANKIVAQSEKAEKSLNSDIFEELERAWSDAAAVLTAQGHNPEEIISKAAKVMSAAQKTEAKRKQNATPEARAARAAYNREHGKDKHIKAQYNYRRRHPERYAAQQKANSESSGGSHSCKVCGKAAKHKHHTSYSGGGKWEWLCHAHHVKRHHPKSDLGKSMTTYAYKPLKKAMAGGGQIPAASVAATGTYISGVDGPVGKPEPKIKRKAKEALRKFAKALNAPGWSDMLVRTPWYSKGRSLDAEFAKGGLSVDAYQAGREKIMVAMMTHLAKAMPPCAEMVMAEPGQAILMDAGYGVPLMAMSAVQVLSSDDLGVYSTLPIGSSMKNFLISSADNTGNPTDMGAERSDMSKSDVFAEILGQDVGKLRKALNNVERGEKGGKIGTPSGPIADGPAGERQLLNKESKNGMPSEAGEGGKEEIWSADDTSKNEMGSKHSLVQATGSGPGSSGDLGSNQVMKKGMVHYYTGEDEYIIKSMDENGCIRQEPTLGMPNTRLVTQHMCGNDLCKSEYSRVLTVCPDCGTSAGAMMKGYRGVIIDRAVARSLRPDHIQDLYVGSDSE